MADKLKEFLKKIHNSRNQIPEYISISIKEGKKIIDMKIRKEKSKILKVTAHEKEKKGWYLHSIHIPIKNLGLPEDSKNKEILPYLNNPNQVLRDRYTQEVLEDMNRKYGEIRAERKKHYFRTERFRVKRELNTGTKLKSF
ncbi:MAG: hypothetical protein EU550_02945 [Promethearchaeota archaeon]|nr:MAG: hypothetical protein EU550_02945 [Candidatus Lokiarchaeota archaeon]